MFAWAPEWGWTLTCSAPGNSASASARASAAAVRQALDYYIQGHATGQGEHFRKAFHTDAKLFAVRDGKYWQLTSEEYIRQRAWQSATLKRCPMHPAGGCGIARHGAYERKQPEGVWVPRWYCREACRPPSRTTGRWSAASGGQAVRAGVETGVY